jgi:hypothetical protein
VPAGRAPWTRTAGTPPFAGVVACAGAWTLTGDFVTCSNLPRAFASAAQTRQWSPGGTGSGFVFVQIMQELAQTLLHGVVAFDFAAPAVPFGIGDQLALPADAGPQLRCVLAGGEELGAGHRKVAFARAFGGQAQSVAEFKFGLEEAGLEPVQTLLIEFAVQERVGGRAGDPLSASEGGLVLAADLRVGDARVDDGHGC